MKKIIITVVLVLILTITLVITAAFYSFSTIVPTTQAINRDLGKYFSTVVYIPNGIDPPVQTFDQTVYQWDMQTNQNEVVGVKLTHDTGFAKGDNTITLTLEKEEKGDPSIFEKVLPAVIADKASLNIALDPKQSNIESTTEASYQSFKVDDRSSSQKATKMEWTFDKNNLPQNIKEEYKKLENSPLPVKFLYNLHNYVVSAFSSQ